MADKLLKGLQQQQQPQQPSVPTHPAAFTATHSHAALTCTTMCTVLRCTPSTSAISSDTTSHTAFAGQINKSEILQALSIAIHFAHCGVLGQQNPRFGVYEGELKPAKVQGKKAKSHGAVSSKVSQESICSTVEILHSCILVSFDCFVYICGTIVY